MPRIARRFGWPSRLGHKSLVQQVVHPFSSDSVQSLGTGPASRSKIDRLKLAASDQIVDGGERYVQLRRYGRGRQQSLMLNGVQCLPPCHFTTLLTSQIARYYICERAIQPLASGHGPDKSTSRSHHVRIAGVAQDGVARSRAKVIQTIVGKPTRLLRRDRQYQSVHAAGRSPQQDGKRLSCQAVAPKIRIQVSTTKPIRNSRPICR